MAYKLTCPYSRCQCHIVVGNISSPTAMAGVRGVIMLSIFVMVVPCVLSYDRPPPRKNLFIPRPKYLSSTSPEQVHISLVGVDKMRISWITKRRAPAVVEYGTWPGVYQFSATGNRTSYRYMHYKSGRIHNVVIGPLEPSTVYYYLCSYDFAYEFSFKTPPSQFPIKFAVVADVGQTEWTNSTLQHIAQSDYDVMLFPGDVSYADTDQPLWDSFGRMMEPLASQRPWMLTEGDHEIETIANNHSTPFTAYNARWRMPFEESGSTSNLYYSFEVAGIHVIMLGSYTDFDTSSDQYKWLQGDLAKINRTGTPWVVVNIHAPWYNSNTAHQGETESVDMKKYMEELLYEARVDVVFSGHVHAYERFSRVYNGTEDNCGAVHIMVGDGGNREGLMTDYIDPQPEVSAFREASFGHGEFEVVNATHAVFTWHRNQDDEAVVSDSVWLESLSSDPACQLLFKRFERYVVVSRRGNSGISTEHGLRKTGEDKLQTIRSGIRALRSASSSGSFLNVVSSSSISATAKVGSIGGARAHFHAAPAYSWEKHEVTTRVLDLLRSITFIDPSKVSATADFKKDLQLDMLDNVEVMMATEEEFVVAIPDNDAEKISTTAHLIDYITAQPQAKWHWHCC